MPPTDKPLRLIEERVARIAGAYFGDPRHVQLCIAAIGKAMREAHLLVETPSADRPSKCPSCESRNPAHHPATSVGGEVTLCNDPWHQPTAAEIRAKAKDAASSSDLPQLLGSLIEAVTDACDSTNSGDQMQAAMRKADGIRLDIERRFALSATSAHISLDDIRQQIDHIEQNGIDLAKYGGKDADEGRCRELCAMYLREMILAHGMQQRLDELDRSEGRDA
jgi:hypothetical protein